MFQSDPRIPFPVRTGQNLATMAADVHQIRDRIAQTGLDPRSFQVLLVDAQVRREKVIYLVHGFLFRVGFCKTEGVRIALGGYNEVGCQLSNLDLV
jgi:hypothetical protein